MAETKARYKQTRIANKAIQTDNVAHAVFFFVPTLVSSAFKADGRLRQQWPRGMYSKVGLATGLDAGEAVLHKGRAQWGRTTCMYCALHAGGGACQDHNPRHLFVRDHLKESRRDVRIAVPRWETHWREGSLHSEAECCLSATNVQLSI